MDPSPTHIPGCDMADRSGLIDSNDVFTEGSICWEVRRTSGTLSKMGGGGGGGREAD